MSSSPIMIAGKPTRNEALYPIRARRHFPPNGKRGAQCGALTDSDCGWYNGVFSSVRQSARKSNRESGDRGRSYVLAANGVLSSPDQVQVNYVPLRRCVCCAVVPAARPWPICSDRRRLVNKSLSRPIFSSWCQIPDSDIRLELWGTNAPLPALSNKSSLAKS